MGLKIRQARKENRNYKQHMFDHVKEVKQFQDQSLFKSKLRLQKPHCSKLRKGKEEKRGTECI